MMILSGARDIADPPLDPRRLAAGGALDLHLTRRRSARHRSKRGLDLERQMRWLCRAVFIALAAATTVRIWIGG